MKRVKLVVAYDGTAYHGWQIQKNGITVEEVLNRELSRLLKEEIVVTGASRTDAGVHALGNVAVFDTNTSIPAEKLAFALNVKLPEDIRIQHSEQVPDTFHPRFQQTIKTYEYRILNRSIPLPKERFYSHFVHWRLDVEKMQKAAAYLVGEHDFKSFCAAAAVVESTVREIYDLTVEKQGDSIVIRVTGNGFLYNMVRILAGTLMQAGLGSIRPEDIPVILEKKDRSAAGPTAPAKGLTLIQIRYPEYEKQMEEAKLGQAQTNRKSHEKNS